MFGGLYGTILLLLDQIQRRPDWLSRTAPRHPLLQPLPASPPPLRRSCLRHLLPVPADCWGRLLEPHFSSGGLQRRAKKYTRPAPAAPPLRRRRSVALTYCPSSPHGRTTPSSSGPDLRRPLCRCHSVAFASFLPMFRHSVGDSIGSG